MLENTLTMRPSLLPTSAPIWLIPSVQLKPWAQSQWATGIMPQIVTLSQWAASIGAVQKNKDDLHFDPGIDRLTAVSLLKRAKQEAKPAYVKRLLDVAYELSQVAAAIEPQSRLLWSKQHAAICQNAVPFQIEGALNHLGLIWAATSSYNTDILWQYRSQWLESVPHFYVTEGLRVSALTQALLKGCEQKISVKPLDFSALGARQNQSIAPLQEYVALDLDDLVNQAASCILEQQPANEKPLRLALVDLDRKITRRLCAVLQSSTVLLTDETGWALSTTVVAAQLMAWLSALKRRPTSDSVLAAMKLAPHVFDRDQVAELEHRIRKASWVQWATTEQQTQQMACVVTFQAFHRQWVSSRTMTEWLSLVTDLLGQLDLWDHFLADSAGQALIAALHLQSSTLLNLDDNNLVSSSERISLTDFIEWVREVLEASRFQPEPLADDSRPRAAESCAIYVTVLTLSQLWGRTFDHVIVPGCSEDRLNPRPALVGDWSRSQRQLLGLCTQDEANQAQATAWSWLCRAHVSFFWAHSEDNEAKLPSSLIEILRFEGRLMGAQCAAVERNVRADQASALDAKQTARQLALKPNVFEHGVVIDWSTLAPVQLSASAYEDLRSCPYRFYATRLLGLSAAQELDDNIDARDVGIWLHAVLYRFHEAEKKAASPSLSLDSRRAQLDALAKSEQAKQFLEPDTFLPYELIWPQIREAYLSWLEVHEAKGTSYLEGEVWRRLGLMIEGKLIELVGKLDRIDQSASSTWLIDYKTESLDKTKNRIKSGSEDTQLAFYAMLVGAQSNDQAAYVSLTDRPPLKPEKLAHPMPDLTAHADALYWGIQQDLTRMAKGEGLRALGEGKSCEYCSVRGLCRRDFK